MNGLVMELVPLHVVVSSLRRSHNESGNVTRVITKGRATVMSVYKDHTRPRKRWSPNRIHLSDSLQLQLPS